MISDVSVKYFKRNISTCFVFFGNISMTKKQKKTKEHILCYFPVHSYNFIIQSTFELPFSQNLQYYHH